MLCSTCGEEVRFKESSLICERCDVEYGGLDFYEELLPEPIFVAIRLSSQHAIVDRRVQKVDLRADTFEKAQLITELLNWKLPEIEFDTQANRDVAYPATEKGLLDWENKKRKKSKSGA